MKKLILIISLLTCSLVSLAQVAEYKPYRTTGNVQVVDSALSVRQFRIAAVTNSLNGYSALNGQSFGYNSSDTTLQFYLGGTYPKFANKIWVTNALATKASKSSFSATLPLSYNSSTGAFSIQAGSGSQNGYIASGDWTNFNTAYTNRITSLTVTGSSGASTLTSNVLNIPTYTLSGLGGVPTTTTVAGFALSSNVTLGTLTPGSTLTNTSGSNYNGSGNTTLDINLTNANSWSGIQTFSPGIVLGSANGLLNGQLVNGIYVPTATSGSYAFDSKELLANNGANSSAAFDLEYLRVGTNTGNTFNITGAIYGTNVGVVHNGTGTLSSTIAYNIGTPSIPNGGTITTSHALLIASQAQAHIGTAYAIYQAGTSDIVALLGTLNLGSLTASKPLFLSAGKNVTVTGPGTALQGIAGDGSLFTPSITQASADLTAQSAAGNITTFTVGAATATFNISAYLNVTAISTDVIQVQVTYTDENNTSQTVSYTTINSITDSNYNPVTIRAKNGTVITVKTNLTVGAGSVTFDAGARITQL
jgi:hypothetical protein